jgi:hypothetical protein
VEKTPSLENLLVLADPRFALFARRKREQSAKPNRKIATNDSEAFAAAFSR